MRLPERWCLDDVDPDADAATGVGGCVTELGNGVAGVTGGGTGVEGNDLEVDGATITDPDPDPDAGKAASALLNDPDLPGRVGVAVVSEPLLLRPPPLLPGMSRVRGELLEKLLGVTVPARRRPWWSTAMRSTRGGERAGRIAQKIKCLSIAIVA